MQGVIYFYLCFYQHFFKTEPYRKKKDYINEIRVLEKAIESYHCNKAYNVKTYEEFKVRLIKAKLLRDKSC